MHRSQNILITLLLLALVMVAGFLYFLEKKDVVLLVDDGQKKDAVKQEKLVDPLVIERERIIAEIESIKSKDIPELTEEEKLKEREDIIKEIEKIKNN